METVAQAAPGRVAMAQRSVSYRDVGTTVKLTARTGPEGAVTVDLQLDSSGIGAADAEAGVPKFDSLKLTTRVAVRPGQATVAHTFRQETRPARNVSLVIVAARVADPGVKAAAR